MAKDDADLDAAERKQIAREARGFKRDLGHLYLILIGVAVFGILVAPVVNRYLEAYQAVVVRPAAGGKVTVLMPDSQVVRRPVPAGLAAGLRPGDYLRKRSMTWNPVRITRAQLTDEPHIEDPAHQPPVALPAYYHRYMSTWSGTVLSVEVRRLPTHGGMGLGAEPKTRTTMVLARDDGPRQTVLVPAKLVNLVRAGTRLEKKARTWLPVVVAQGAPIPPAGDGGTAAGARDGGSGGADGGG